VTGDCLVAAITSIRPPSLLPGEVPLSPEDQAAGAMALDRRLIRRTLGRLPDATVEALLAEMKRFLIER
jgi:mRNA-degrading endonuclease toxin of MazEF toxin-antitoxin module